MKRLQAALVGALAAAASACAAESIPATPEKEAILKTVDAFFIALGKPDPDAMEKLVAPTAVTVIVRPEAEEKVVYRNFSDTIAQMRGGSFAKIREPYWEPIVLERSGLAVVWTPYYVDVNDKRVHCGIDVFNMSKHGTDWKIDSVHYTAEPSACDALKPKNENAVLRPDFSALDAAGE